MKRLPAAALLTVLLASGITACGGADEFDRPTDGADATLTSTSETASAPTETTANAGPIIKPFGETLVGQDGKEVTIDSAESQGSQTIIALRYKAGTEAIEDYNILTPTLSYGPDGTEAEVDTLPEINGVIVPGQSKVVSYTFNVDAAQLNPATLTVGIGLGSATWTGNLTEFIAK